MLSPETMTIDERQRSSSLLENGRSTSIGTDEREEIAEDVWRRTEHFLYKKMKFQTSSTILKVLFLFFIGIIIFASGFGLGRMPSGLSDSNNAERLIEGCPNVTTTNWTTTAPVTTTPLETTIAPVTTTTPKQALGCENKNIMTDANYTYMIVSYYEYNKSKEVDTWQSCTVKSTFEDDKIPIYINDSQDTKMEDLVSFVNNTMSEIFKCDSCGTCTRKCHSDLCQHSTIRRKNEQEYYEEPVHLCTFTNCKGEREEGKVRFSTSLICKLDKS